jgi:long-subunit fatty acid transport protein
VSGPTIVAGAAIKKDPNTQAAIAAYAIKENLGAMAQEQIAGLAAQNDTDTQLAILNYKNSLSAAQLNDLLISQVGTAPEPFVDLSFKSTVLTLNYKVNDRVDVFGGIKYSTGSATGNVLSDPHGDLAASDASGTAPVLGVSYSIPDIALRVTATYQGKTETSHATTRTYNSVESDLENTKAALPESFTLDFQTGIAKDTLLFGSIHRAKWGGAHIYFDGASEPKTSWTDSTSYSLGVGRKINENWAISASYNYEEGTESSGTSLLSTTNGVRGVTLGARYTMDKMVVSLGVNYSEFGDKTVTAAPLGTGKFSNNSMTSVGLKIGYRF